MIQKISKEDIELIRKFEELSLKGFYVNSQQVTDAYNRILNKNVGNTTCPSCLKQRIAELVMVRNRYELELELSKDIKTAETTEEVTESVEESEMDILEALELIDEKPKKRKKKQKEET